jgi:transposase-like protein
MPWTESDAMDQRLRFVTDALSDRFTMTELCARYGVSRRIGYKWLARFSEDGKRGLADRSRRPHTCPTQIRPVLAELLCEFRRLHPDWGARKLLHVLRRRHPGVVPIATAAPNDMWTTDFKGQFRTGNGAYCYPLTSPTSTRASCSSATGCSRPRRPLRGRCSSACSASTGCRWRSARTTASRSPRWPSTASRT